MTERVRATAAQSSAHRGGRTASDAGCTVTRFVLRRLLWAIPTLLLVTFLVYVAIRIGTDPVASYQRVNQRASDAKIQEYIEINGLYEGVGGYIRGYFKWLGQFLSGEWPRTHQGQPRGVAALKDAMFNSLRLGGIATILGISIGLAVGVFAALRPGQPARHVRQHGGVLRSVHPAVRLGGAAPAALRRLLEPVVRRRAAPDVGRVPDRPPRLRPRG